MFQRRFGKRGSTLLETTVGICAFSGVAVFIVALIVVAGKQTNRTLRTLPQETESFRTMDRLRTQLLPAAADTMTLSDDKRTMAFYHAPSNSEAQLTFDPNTKELVLDSDTSVNNDEVVLGTFEDVTFDTKNYGRYVSVTVKEFGRDSKNKPVLMSRQEWLRVRN